MYLFHLYILKKFDLSIDFLCKSWICTLPLLVLRGSLPTMDLQTQKWSNFHEVCAICWNINFPIFCNFYTSELIVSYVHNFVDTYTNQKMYLKRCPMFWNGFLSSWVFYVIFSLSHVRYGRFLYPTVVNSELGLEDFWTWEPDSDIQTSDSCKPGGGVGGQSKESWKIMWIPVQNWPYI